MSAGPEPSFLQQACVYLGAAVVSVPIAKRLGLGSVLGYLIAGAVIGPWGFKLTGANPDDVRHFAEFGVVMMLFLVGLELRPSRVWSLRVPILGMGGLQVVMTAALVLGMTMGFGLDWRLGLGAGLALAMSSTAIAIQSLQERGLLGSGGGQAAFSVLVFQDISVIPILALLPLVGTAAKAAVPGAPPAWQQALLVLGAVGGVIVAGRYGLRPVFRWMAGTHLRELFTATALLLVVGIALLMEAVGLSAALGTFLAGVVLAESEYRHELESDLEPFKGLLLGLFFIAVGAGIDFGLIARKPGLVAALVGALILLKGALLYILGRGFRIDPAQAALFACALAAGGEFAFVLLGFCTQNGVLTGENAALLVAVVAMSLAAAPLLFVLHEKVLSPWLMPCSARGGPRREQDDVHSDGEGGVIVAGFGRFGHIVGRMLRANHVPTTVLDLDPDQVDLLRKLGIQVFYGDASRLDLLHAAGAERAKLFVLAIDQREKSLEIVQTLRHEFPRLRILARAIDRQHAYELIQLGVTDVYRETFGTSLEMGVDALRAMGFRAIQARRAAQSFQERDEASVRELAPLWGKTDEGEYFQTARKIVASMEDEIRKESGPFHSDRGWEPPPAPKRVESVAAPG